MEVTNDPVNKGNLRRNKATTFHERVIPRATFDLQYHFVFSPDHAPNDVREMMGKEGEVVSEHSVAKYMNDERPDDTHNDLEEDQFKTVASVEVHEADMVYTRLLQISQCYEAMANNNKLLVFTDDMTVKKAFYALIYNSMRTGLVCDSQTMAITSVLSVTDFIMVLMMLWKYRDNIDDFKGTPLTHEDFKKMDISYIPIKKWKVMLKGQGNLRPFIHINLTESLFRAVELLAEHRIHRLPVMDEKTNDCAYILTHRRILHYLWKHCASLSRPEYMNTTAKELKIGTWKHVIHAKMATPLIEVLDMLIDNEISGLPVLDDKTSMVVEVYTRFDAVSACFSEDIDLGVPVSKAIEQRAQICGIRRDGVVTAHEDSNMWKLIETFIEKNVHRIFMTDENKQLKGIVSLSDVTEYMVLRPATNRQKLINQRIHQRTIEDIEEMENE